MALAESKTHSSFEGSTTTFWLSSFTPNSEKTLYEVPKIVGDPLRQRRAHRKSSRGCDNCKKRRVKCNEGAPCANCVRRGQHCRRIVRCDRTVSVPPAPTTAPPSTLQSRENDDNLLHYKLYHHFQAYTIPTLLFSPEVWQHALQLSFQFDFLANAIMCLAARHLSALSPEDTSYSTTAAAHLGRALSQFRQKLSGDFKSIHIDAFIATSLLLQYEVWTNTDDYSSLQKNGSLSFDAPRDSIFAFCSSLKKMFLNCVPMICDQPSVFMPYIRHDSRNFLIETAEISNNTLTAYQIIFSYERPLSASSIHPRIPHSRCTNLVTPEQWQYSAPKTQEVADPIEDCYKPIITQLCLILSFLPESRPDAVGKRPPPFSELVKYVLSFPVICHGPFNSMIQQGDAHALLLLYHFYRAMRILIPENQCWWVHKRTRVSEAALKDWLTRQTIEQRAKEAFKYSHITKVS